MAARRKTGPKGAKLTLEEKCYLVAVFGDIRPYRQAALFEISRFPAQLAGAMLTEGRNFVDRIAGTAPRRLRRKSAKAQSK
jgi:hypothetical protein